MSFFKHSGRWQETVERLKLEGFDHRSDLRGKNVIITRSNFGCGSSREHAPWALEMNGINLVIAEGFARIFRQNMYNCGMMAVELPPDTIEQLFNRGRGREVEIDNDFDKSQFIITINGETERISYSINDFDRALVLAGGWLEYADLKY